MGNLQDSSEVKICQFGLLAYLSDKCVMCIKVVAIVET